MRVLILDFDFFGTMGGGQTFYRRVVERHPDMSFFYPSRGLDLRRREELPPNARPFAFERRTRDEWVRTALQDAGVPSILMEEGEALCAVACAQQGESFDVVEVPSFRPCAHLVRPIFAAFGIRVERISVGLLGWISASLGKIPAMAALAAQMKRVEGTSLAAADTCYTISALHAAENAAYGISMGIVDMHDALEEFGPPPLEPPGKGPPDLWFVGRPDVAKAPDLFLAIAARLPRETYNRMALAGPDNTWSPVGQRLSDAVMKQGRELGLDVTFHGGMSDAALRADVYGGRSVLVIPSRTDSFNLVALEALAHGTPVLLSRHAGAAEFLARHHPAIAPPVIEPEDVDSAAAILGEMLTDYPARATALRAALHAHPLPKPRQYFLAPHWFAPSARPPAEPDRALFARMRAAAPLGSADAAPWRPRLWPDGDVTAVVAVRDGAEALRGTLVALARQQGGLRAVLVIDDGSDAPVELDCGGEPVRLIRQGRRGLAATLNRGCVEAHGDLVLLFVAGDLPGPTCVRSARAAFAAESDDPPVALGLPWAWLEAGGLAPCAMEAPQGWQVPALLCAAPRFLAAGGFTAVDDGMGLSAPSTARLAAAPSGTPMAWRPRDALQPWGRKEERKEGLEG